MHTLLKSDKNKLILYMYITNYMEQSPSSEANRSSAIQEIPRMLWNLKIYYRIHKNLPPVPVLSHIDAVRAPLTLLRDPFQYYPPIYARVFQVVSFPQVSPLKPCMHLYSPHACYMPCHLSLLDLVIQMVFGEECRA
jgi:hypothetical protein